MDESLPLRQTTTYTFKYNSDADSIDLDTLLLSQIHFGTILNEIKNEVAGDANLEIKIKPLAKGSVPFDITLNLSWIQSLFSPDSMAYASAIVSTLVGIIQLKMWLKGDKPAKIEVKDNKVVIEVNGAIIEIDKTAYNIYNTNVTIDAALKKSFEVIEKDEDVTGIEILDERKHTLVSVERNQFSYISSPNQELESFTRKESISQIALTIFKVVFGKGYKWQFYYNGRKIPAIIKDDAFMELVNNGERFAKGDTLVVDLEIERVYDKTLDIYVERDFKITKVIRHIPRPEQQSLGGLLDEITNI